MMRPAGADAPEPPAGLEVVPVTTTAELDTFTSTLVDAFPILELAGVPYGGYGEALLDLPGWHMWVGYLDGKPVATSATYLHGGTNHVEWISTRPEARGRGIGAAVTWTATKLDPSLPALLIASDDGQPVYERMGYLRVTRFTLWFRRRG